jgi:hypothetical protein
MYIYKDKTINNIQNDNINNTQNILYRYYNSFNK